MHLKLVELKGFKSFARPTAIELRPGMTGVVGPNGSGKSNVLEAIAWALGIQGPSMVRSSRMEEVIFDGSEGQPSLGRAEVKLTFDNSDGAVEGMPPEFSLARVVWRGGEGEYFINDQPVRLMDLQELVADLGLGRSRHIYVGQGHVDAVLHMSDQEKRIMIEEAAGIAKHKKRKEDAERRLERAREHAAQLRSRVRELEKRVEPLRAQGEALRRRSELEARRRRLEGELLQLRAQAVLEGLRVLGREREEIGAALEARKRALDEIRASSSRLEKLMADTGLEWVQEQIASFARLEERAEGIFRLCQERIRGLEGSGGSPGAGGAHPGRDPLADLEERRSRLLARAEQLAQEEAEVERLRSRQEAAEAGLKRARERLAHLEAGAVGSAEGPVLTEVGPGIFMLSFWALAKEAMRAIESGRRPIEGAGAPGEQELGGQVLPPPPGQASQSESAALLASLRGLYRFPVVLVGQGADVRRVRELLDEQPLVVRAVGGSLGQGNGVPFRSGAIEGIVEVLVPALALAVTVDLVPEEVVSATLRPLARSGLGFEEALSIHLRDPSLHLVTREGYVLGAFGCFSPRSGSGRAADLEKARREYRSALSELERTRSAYLRAASSLSKEKAEVESELAHIERELARLRPSVVAGASSEGPPRERGPEGTRLSRERVRSILSALMGICQKVAEEARGRLDDLGRARQEMAAARARASSEVAAYQQIAQDYEKEFASLTERMSAVTEGLGRLEAELAGLRAAALAAGMDEAEVEALMEGAGRREDAAPGAGSSEEEGRDQAIRELETALDRTRRELASLGPVNELALGELESLEGELSELREALADAEKASRELRRLSSSVERALERSFAQALADIGEEFQAVFGQLFPGGAARLHLTEDGVSIEASPAGKRLKRLGLLSGGERSLAALAFLIGVFRARPSPFYLLDEVEAALDDANLERLLRVLVELKQGAQILIATHQRRTMEVCDWLCGVSMGRDGTSVVVTASV
jgi:chromosome segregation protein